MLKSKTPRFILPLSAVIRLYPVQNQPLTLRFSFRVFRVFRGQKAFKSFFLVHGSHGKHGQNLENLLTG
jgi:hypothetical protein